MRYFSLIAIAVAYTTPGVAVFDNCENHYFAEVDYLAWFVDQEGMSYATAVDATSAAFTIGNSTSSLSGKDLFFRTNWDSGVRGVLGFKPKNKSWDTRLVYSYYQTKDSPKQLTSQATSTSTMEGSAFVTLVEGTAIVPAYFSVNLPFVITGLVDNIQTLTYAIDPLWKFNFNQLDLEFSNEYFVSCDASVRFFGGMRGLWTNQKFEETFSIVSNLTMSGVEQFVQSSTALFKEQNKFSAFGARAGLDFNYDICNGLDIYASLAGSILWGWFNDRQSYDATTLISPVQSFDRSESFRHSHHTSIFNFDTALGIRWNYWLNCNRNLLTLRFGWEQHIYTGINQFQRFSSDPSIEAGISNFNFGASTLSNDHNVERGDLSLSGFVVGLAYTY